MSAAIYIVLNSTDPGFDTWISGKALARNYESLTDLAESLGVPPLMSFYSTSPEEIDQYREEFEVDCSASSALEEEWFDPEQGLVTVSALLESEKVKSGLMEPGVVADLQNLERILKAAQDQQLKWYLTIDY